MVFKQQILTASKGYSELDNYFLHNSLKKVLLVCSKFVPKTPIGIYFSTLKSRLGIDVVTFNDYTPNPLYESVVEGIRIFNENKCDSIIAVGGGSAMDVAKCIKLFSNMDSNINYFKQEIIPNDIKLIAVPTTAGTGSEATKYAVIYYGGTKQSITHESCIPSTVLFDSSLLETLPEYQRKSTMLDALCHAMESYWSVNSNRESFEYSDSAIRMIIANKDRYLANEDIGNANMLQAANLAGKAINITQTTAGHAMSYKITSLCKIPHGYAVALCVSRLFPYMLRHTDECIDPRGKEHLEGVFDKIAFALGCSSAYEATIMFNQMLDGFELALPKLDESQFKELCSSVNVTRLKNNPICLYSDVINYLYHQIWKKE